jgi:hypothetical protein
MQGIIGMAWRYQPPVVLTRNQEINSLSINIAFSLNAIEAGNNCFEILDQFLTTGGKRRRKKTGVQFPHTLVGNLETTELWNL